MPTALIIGTGRTGFPTCHHGRLSSLSRFEMPTALITGASSGIGESFAYALARQNSDLVLVAPISRVFAATALSRPSRRATRLRLEKTPACGYDGLGT